jgi:hypothetical protein
MISCSQYEGSIYNISERILQVRIREPSIGLAANFVNQSYHDSILVRRFKCLLIFTDLNDSSFARSVDSVYHFRVIAVLIRTLDKYTLPTLYHRLVIVL